MCGKKTVCFFFNEFATRTWTQNETQKRTNTGQPSESEQANREDVEALGGRLEALEMKVTSQYTVLEEYLSQLSKDLRTRKSRPGDLWDKARNWNRAGCGAPRPDRPRAKTVSERPKKMPNPEPPQIATEPVSKKPAPAPTPSSMPLHEGAADGLRFQKKQPAPPNKPLPTSPVLSAEGSSTTVVQSKPTPLHQMPGSPEHLGYKVVGFPRFNTEDLLGGVLHTESPMWHAGGGGSVDGSESELEKTAATTASKSSTTLTIPRADSYPEQQQQQQAKAGCLKSSLKIGGSPAAGNQRKTTKVTLPLLVARGPPNSAENSPRVQGQGTSPTLETPVQDGDRSFPGGTFALESSFNPAWLNNSFGTYANFYGAHNASFGTFSEPPDECGSASSTPSAYAETSLITGDKSGASAGVVITLTAVIKVAAYASQLNLLRRSQPSSHAKIPDLVVQSPSVPTSIDADSRAGTPIDPLGGTTSSLHTIGSPVRPCDATPHKYKDKYPHHHPVHVATQDPDPPAEQPPKPAHPVDASPRGNTSTGNKTAVQKRRTLRSNDDGVDPTSSPGFETRLRDRLHSRVNSTKQKLNELQEIRTTEDSSFEQLRGRLKKLRETRDTKETPTAPAAENMPEGTGTSTGRPAADAAGPLWQQAQASIGELSANNNNTNNNNTKNGNTNSSSNKTPTASPAEGTHPIEHGAAREDTNASAEDDGDLLAVQSLLERETGYRLQKTVSQVGNGKKHRRDLMNGTSAGAPRAFQGLRRAGTSSSLYAHQLRPSPVLRRRKPSQLTDVGELAAHHGQHASSTSVLDNYRTLHSSTPSSSVSPRGPPQFFTLGRSTSEQPTPRHLTELALPSPKASMNTPSGSVKSRRRSDDGDYLQPLRLSPTSDSGAVFSRKSGSSSWATTVEAVPWESELPSLQSINSFVRLQAGVQSPNYFPTSRHHWGDSDDESTSGDVVSLHSPRVDGHTPAHKLPHNRRASEVTVRRAPSSSSMHAAPPKGRPGSPATLSSASSATSKSEMQLQVDSILKLSTLK
ncbi:hypothetical protein DIPPA_30406 [Diplonema papillatum]|nr:hypothetical protein DIPPA_30406 [Diplonema papillatum]